MRERDCRRISSTFVGRNFAAYEGFENESLSYFRGIGIAVTQIAVES